MIAAGPNGEELDGEVENMLSMAGETPVGCGEIGAAVDPEENIFHIESSVSRSKVGAACRVSDGAVILNDLDPVVVRE